MSCWWLLSSDLNRIAELVLHIYIGEGLTAFSHIPFAAASFKRAGVDAFDVSTEESLLAALVRMTGRRKRRGR